MTSGNDLLNQLDDAVAYTRTYPDGHFIALYAYGSFSRSEMDDWSDIDICVIRRDTDAALASYRTWLDEIYGRYDFRIDPMGLSEVNIGERSYWGVATYLRGLIVDSTLLFGDDIRPIAVIPTVHKLRLSMSDLAAICLRSHYEIPNREPLPRLLPPFDISDREPKAWGNAAHAAYSTVMHLVRVVALLESGVMCDSKKLVYDRLQQLGDRDLLRFCRKATDLRKTVPRFGPLPQIPGILAEVCSAVPELASRFLTALDKCGLQDPSCQPDGQSFYENDGSPRFLPSDCQPR